MKQGNILFFTSWGYREGLIQSYTLPNLKIIQSIRKNGLLFLATEEKQMDDISPAYIENINQELAQYAIVWKPRRYVPAGGKKMLFMLREVLYWYFFSIRNNIQIFHSLCTPAGIYSYLQAKLRGRKLVIDSFEPHTMYMTESGVWSKTSVAYKFLYFFERRMVKRADHVVANTLGMREYAKNVFGAKNTDRFLIKPACVDLDFFKYNEADRLSIRTSLNLDENAIVGIYAGKFGGTYLSQETFDFFREAYDYWKDRFFLILLSGQSGEEIEQLCAASGFPTERLWHKSVDHFEVVRYLSAADFAFTPVRPTPSKKYCTPVKDGEYWAVGLPVVITKDISDDSDIIKREKAGSVIESLDRAGYQSAIYEMDAMLKNQDKHLLRQHIRAIAEKYRSYSIAQAVYNTIYNTPV